MKKYFIFLLGGLFLFNLITSFCYADSINITPPFSSGTANLDQHCGFASQPGKNQCCHNQDFYDSTWLIKNTPIQHIPVVGDISMKLFSLIVDQGFKLVGLDNLLASTKCFEGEPVNNGNSCICQLTQTSNQPTPTPAALMSICQHYFNRLGCTYDNCKDTAQYRRCLSCAETGGILTAVGCIPGNLGAFISKILSIGIGLGGLISLFCIISAAFAIQTSQGNPEKIKKAKDNLTTCIIGLILIIFAIFILRFIGVAILQLPQFK